MAHILPIMGARREINLYGLKPKIFIKGNRMSLIIIFGFVALLGILNLLEKGRVD